MLAVATQRKHQYKRTAGTWSPEQQRAMLGKAAEGRRKAAERRRIERAKSVAAIDAIALNPIADLEARLVRATRDNKSTATLNRLAEAIAKLKRASVYKSSPSASNTPTACSPVRQPTPSIPQSTQAAEPKHVQADASFAQYTEPLVRGSKESLCGQTVGAPVGVGTGLGVGVGGVIDPITRRPNSGPLLSEATVDQLEARLAQLRGVKGGPVKAESVKPYGLVGPVPVSGAGSIGVGPQEGMEKFLVGGTWVWGRRKK